MVEDQEIGEEDYDDLLEFTNRERRLVTQSYDLSVSTLLEQWTDGTLQLPEIQRQYVWDNARASKLIESLLLNIPIPVVYFAETEDVNYLVIDGHQRINSIARFLQNEFALSSLKILGDLNRKRFHQLNDRDQRQLKTRVIRAIIISADSDDMMQFEVFERLNTGSIALNAQEVRNSTHRGPMNELIKELAREPSFRACVGTKLPRPRMVDNELILRYLALMDSWETYRPPLKRYLNNYMSRANAFDSDGLEAVRDVFEYATEIAEDLLGDGAFRLTDKSGRPVDRSVNRALAEVQLTVFSWVQDAQEIVDNRKAVLAALRRLYANKSFLDSIQRATGDRKRTHRRLGMFCEALEEAGVSLQEAVAYEAPE